MTTVEVDGDMAIVRIGTDRLDAAATPAFKSALDANFPAGAQRLILDASGVGFADSTGLGAIVSLMKRLPEGGTLVIAAAQQPLRRLLQVTGLDGLFRQFESVEEARDAIGR